MTDANSILMGSASAPGWKFEEPGACHVGTVAEPPRAVQEREYNPNSLGGGSPKFFPSGDPIMGVHVTMQTSERNAADPEDDGRRTFYIEGRYIKEAVRDAIRKVGAAGLEVGGQISVTFTHREDPNDKRSRKFWRVEYVPAGNAALMSAPAPADPGGVPRAQSTPPVAAPAPAPIQQAPAAPPPVQAPPAAAPAAPQLDAAAVLAQIKTFTSLGMTDRQILGATPGLTPDVLAAVKGAIAVGA